ncbi:MAG: hypothetical protein U0R24_11410 [Solirubrobacterales bacterium]
MKLCTKLEGGDPKRVKVTTEAADLAGCDLVVEASPRTRREGHAARDPRRRLP